MRRPRHTIESRKKILLQIDKRYTSEQRKRRLYNRVYRKSFIFIGAWVARIIYILLFISVMVFNKSSGGFRNEKLISKSVDSYVSHSKYRNGAVVSTLYLETESNSYESNISNVDVPELFINDTLQIERNIFGKAIYFTKKDWGIKYSISTNFVIYYMILFLTIISFFFNDGLDLFTSKILWLCYAVNIIAIAVYFFT
jgi:hypothetical protein